MIHFEKYIQGKYYKVLFIQKLNKALFTQKIKLQFQIIKILNLKKIITKNQHHIEFNVTNHMNLELLNFFFFVFYLTKRKST